MFPYLSNKLGQDEQTQWRRAYAACTKDDEVVHVRNQRAGKSITRI